MYARALGVMAPPCDPIGNMGLLSDDPSFNANLLYDDATGCWIDTGIMYLQPTVTGPDDPFPLGPVLIQPVRVGPTTIPQQLPTLTVTAHPATAGLSGGVGLLVLLALGAWALKKGGGNTRSW